MQAEEFRLVESDEFNHTPTADSNFNESVYVNGFDPVQRCGGWMRIGNRANEGYAEALKEFSVFYQPTNDGRATPLQMRHTKAAAAA